MFQRSKQLPMALQTVFSMRRNEEKDHPFCRRWRCWQQGRPDQQAYWMNKVFTTIFVICSLNRDCFQAEKKERKEKRKTKKAFKYTSIGNSLAVQWLAVHTVTVESPDSIPSQGTKILQV